MLLKVVEYVHRSNDEFNDWEVDLGEDYLRSEASQKLHCRLMELRVVMHVDTETGEYSIQSIADGKDIFVPKLDKLE